MEQPQQNNRRSRRKNPREPQQKEVFLVNDDVTTFDFVIRMLEAVFFKTEEEAARIAVETDSNGEALVGAYLADIAESKAFKAETMARTEGFPLVVEARSHRA